MNPEVHPDNKNFSWSVPKGPYQYLSEEQVEQYDRKGYLVLEDAFDIELMSKISNLIDPFEKKVTKILKMISFKKSSTILST